MFHASAHSPSPLPASTRPPLILATSCYGAMRARVKGHASSRTSRPQTRVLTPTVGLKNRMDDEEATHTQRRPDIHVRAACRTSVTALPPTVQTQVPPDYRQSHTNRKDAQNNIPVVINPISVKLIKM